MASPVPSYTAPGLGGETWAGYTMKYTCYRSTGDQVFLTIHVVEAADITDELTLVELWYLQIHITVRHCIGIYINSETPLDWTCLEFRKKCTV